MSEFFRKLCWWIHRLLCYVGVHASEKVSRYVEEKDDFEEVGTFCPVCMKHKDYEEVEEDEQSSG